MYIMEDAKMDEPTDGVSGEALTDTFSSYLSPDVAIFRISRGERLSGLYVVVSITVTSSPSAVVKFYYYF